MVDWAADVVERIGLLGVALLLALESVFPPIPSELVLLLNGFNVSDGRFAAVGAVVAATIGSVVGAWVLYGLGAWWNEDRMERTFARLGRFVGVQRSDVDRAFAWFARHGAAVVFFGRFVPVVRSLVSVPAGAERMHAVPFTLLTALGSLVWNALWIGVGWQLGDQWEKAEKWSELIEAVVLGIAVVAVAGWWWRRRRQVHRASAPSGGAERLETAGEPSAESVAGGS